MPEAFDIAQYLSDGVESIVKDVLRATFRDLRESIFMARFAKAAGEATKRRSMRRYQALTDRHSRCV